MCLVQWDQPRHWEWGMQGTGSLHAGSSTSSSAVPGTQVSGARGAGRCSPWACGVQLDVTGLTSPIRGKWSQYTLSSVRCKLGRRNGTNQGESCCPGLCQVPQLVGAGGKLYLLHSHSARCTSFPWHQSHSLECVAARCCIPGLLLGCPGQGLTTAG